LGISLRVRPLAISTERLEVRNGIDGQSHPHDPAAIQRPPASANGGYLAGALAQHVPGSADAIKVTLRKPPPLAVPMAVTDLPGNVVHLHSQATLIAEAEPGYIDVSDAPPSVEIGAAKAAELRFQDTATTLSPRASSADQTEATACGSSLEQSTETRACMPVRGFPTRHWRITAPLMFGPSSCGRRWTAQEPGRST
jgi:hypothetical protein